MYLSFLVSDCYNDTGRTKKAAENHVSMLNFYPNVISLFLFVITGYLCDKLKIWKILLFVNFFCIIFQVLLIYDMFHNKCEIGFLFDFSFIAIESVYACGYMASIALLIKLVNKRTRGSILALNGFVGSVFMSINNGISGYLYSNVSR